MGYCWSSIMPTSSANGLSVSTSSACGSPVIWMAIHSSCPMTPGLVAPGRARLPRLSAPPRRPLRVRRVGGRSAADELLGLLDGDAAFRVPVVGEVHDL